MTVHHAIDEEWLGEALLDVTLRSDGETLDEMSTQLRVVMTPVNDTRKIRNRSIQEMDEDGPAWCTTSRRWFPTRRGAVEVHIEGVKTGNRAPFSTALKANDHAHAAQQRQRRHGLQVLVSDGENPSLLLESPSL